MMQPQYPEKITLTDFFVILGTGIFLSVPNSFLIAWIGYKHGGAWWFVPAVLSLCIIAGFGIYCVKIACDAVRDGMVRIGR